MLLDGLNGEKLLCEELESGNLRICRVFGSTEELKLPEQLKEGVITEIGAYCFAERGRLKQELADEVEKAGLGDGTNPSGGRLRPICGNYLKRVELPDSISSLETYAFYNCRMLESLTIGAKLTEVHSDAFMNCRKLQELVLRCDISEVSGLQFMLNQLTAELAVSFNGREKSVKLLYPEYTESYEEIGPAHIFSLHVEGEGYRARKQFADGRVDVSGYDQVFEKASNEEHFLTLMKMALYRLEYPYGLSDEAHERYESYIREHETAVLEQLTRNQDEDTLKMMCSRKEVSDEAVQAAVVCAVAEGWTRGAAGIIRWRHMKRSL